MLCEIFVFATHDLNIDAEFPHEFSAYADGGPATYIKGKGDLSRDVFTGVNQTRTVTTEGLQGPAHGVLDVQPPKYPPCRLEGRRCDHTIIGPVENHAEIIVYVIDTIDPDDYDSLPAAMKGMKRNDPIGDDLWLELLTGMVSVTTGDDNKFHVDAAMSAWRRDNPEGTAEGFVLALRRFTS
jgi:hypothetical protein